jgi:hypothetical protein
MPWHIALHFDRVAGKSEWFLKDVVHCLEAFADYDQVGDEEIPRVLAVWASSEPNRSLLTPMLRHDYGSDVATAAGLLLQGGAISDELQREFEELFEVEVSASQRPPRVGLALSHGELRPIAEIIFEALGGGRDRPM